MRILLLSAYDAESHRYWHAHLVAAFTEHCWTVLTLPARHFAWRVRGNSLTWAQTEREKLSRHYDLLIATSMCDLSALRGMVPALAGVPTVLYFHENQFAYPANSSQYGALEPQMLSIYSALCADVLVFNSHYNHDTFLAGAHRLLNKLPDGVPRNLSQQLRDKARVLPVPLRPRSATRATEMAIREHNSRAPLHILWNHRWEYDKGPDLLRDIVEQLLTQKTPFRLHVVGQQFRRQPEAFAQLAERAAAHIDHWGYLEAKQEYVDLLQHCDVVLSTALHDFQGLSVLEAVQAGCLPVLPHRLVYPEWFDAAWCYAGKDQAEEAQQAATRLHQLAELKQKKALPSAPSVAFLGWAALHKAYAELLTSAAGTDGAGVNASATDPA